MNRIAPTRTRLGSRKSRNGCRYAADAERAELLRVLVSPAWRPAGPAGSRPGRTALTASAARKRPPRYSALRSGEVKRSGSMPASTSRTAASPKSAAETSMPNSPTNTETSARRSGALTWREAPSAVARNIQNAGPEQDRRHRSRSRRCGGGTRARSGRLREVSRRRLRSLDSRRRAVVTPVMTLKYTSFRSGSTGSNSAPGDASA